MNNQLKVTIQFKEDKKIITQKLIKTNNGITLIALVITIIILLILAGITIAALSGQNGILNRAKEAKEGHDKSSAREQLDLLKADWTIQKYTSENQSLGSFLAEKKQRGAIDDYADLGDEIFLITIANEQLVLDNGNTAIWDGTSVSKNMVGSGTEEDPFLIKNGNDFKFLQNAIASKNTRYTTAFYKQIKDIQLNDVSNYDTWISKITYIK